MNTTLPTNFSCPKCGVKQPKTESCQACGVIFAKIKDFPQSNSSGKIHDRIALTTAPWLEGYKVVETLEIITAECVYGMNMFRDFFAGITDALGGRSGATQNVLRDARTTCLEELKKEAFRIGANAVIAVDLDYSEFSGQGKSMLFLVASGTAVKVEKITNQTPHNQYQTQMA